MWRYFRQSGDFYAASTSRYTARKSRFKNSAEVQKDPIHPNSHQRTGLAGARSPVCSRCVTVKD
jgi:hypothetical protein